MRYYANLAIITFIIIIIIIIVFIDCFFSSKGREIATKGGAKQVFMVENMANNNDDPIFSLPGDLAINWWYHDNGARIALTGGHLSQPNIDDDSTHGLGNNFWVKRKTGISITENWKHEIANIQNCPSPACHRSKVKIQGTDHGSGLKSGPVYGNYAIYVSRDAGRFPSYRKLLMLEMDKS